jgi:hypothetical protein
MPNCSGDVEKIAILMPVAYPNTTPPLVTILSAMSSKDGVDTYHRLFVYA